MRRTATTKKRKKTIRQKPRRKRKGAKSHFKVFLWSLAGIALAIVVGMIIYDIDVYTRTSERFAVTEVDVGGTVLLTQTEIIRAIGLPASVNIRSINEKTITEQVIALPRVRTAYVKKKIPKYLGVTIIERPPVAVIGDDPPIEIDIEGIVLGPARQENSITPFPTLTGKQLPRTLVTGGKITDETVHEALALCKVLEQSQSLPLLGTVTIDTTDPANLVMKINGVDAEIRWGTQNYEMKLGKLMAVWNKTSGNPTHSEYIDLRQGRYVPAK